MRRMPAAAFPRLTKPELFARLAEGMQAGVTVITPNRRLAQELAREFDADRISHGLQAWEAADRRRRERSPQQPGRPRRHGG